LSEENLKSVRRLVTAFNDRDLDSFLADLHPEVEFHSLRAQLEGRPYVGHEGARKMFTDFDEDWDYLHLELEDLRDTEHTVVAVGHLISRGRASHVDLDVPVAFMWRFRDDKVVYGKVFSDPSDALRAAGLS
jgi:ketosteroid isomerase-like protein